MPYLDVSPPPDALPGEPHEYSVTRFFLELTDATSTTNWFRTGRWAEEGHVTEAEARNEWADRTDRPKYTGHRVIQLDWVCTATVRPEPA